MDTGVTIDYGKVPGLLKRMRDNEGLKAGIPDAADYLRSRAAYYPPRRPQVYQPSHNWTPRQRRYFWWARGQGLIRVPYRRTFGMAKAWRVVMAPDGMSAQISNPTTAARYTKHPQHQSFYHRGNWPTTDEDVKRYGPEAYKRVYNHVGRSLEPR